MTPNPNENQAEKHSAEPWSVATNSCLIQDSNGMRICDTFNGSVETGILDAARIVACVNFCAGVPNTTLAEIGSLKASGETILNGLQKLNERFEKGQQLRAELSTLRKELEAAKKNAGEVLNEMRAYCGDFEFDESDACMKPTFDRLKRITGELLNNGKDGK